MAIIGSGSGSGRLADRNTGDRYFHPQFNAHTVKVLLGFHRISSVNDEMLVTTLGSCVAACVRDPVAAVGGMNHFLLPEVPEGHTEADSAATRYGSVAMELLINDILNHGGKRNRLEAKVFGGAKVIDTSMDVGQLNGQFVLDYLQNENIPVVSQDLGGLYARRVHYFPVTGRAMRRLLRPEALSETLSQEMNFRSTLKQKPIAGDVELFG